MRKVFQSDEMTVTVDTNLVRHVCLRCQAIEISEEAKAKLKQLEKQIESLFEVQQPDLTCAAAPDGTKAVTLSAGVVQRDDNEDEAIKVLLGRTWEKFQQAFGEHATDRQLWWRERPNIIAVTDFYTRSIQRAIWMRIAIPNLTAKEIELLKVDDEYCTVDLEAI